MKRNNSNLLFSITIILPFVAAVAYLHFVRDVPFKIFVFGSGSWGVGCLLKIVLHQGIIRKLRHDAPRILGVSALNGLISGMTELGMALVFFAFLPVLSLWEVIAFGTGIGTVEAFVVTTRSNPLKGTMLEKADAEFEAVVAGLQDVKRFIYGRLVPFVERLVAGAIHIGTRGLVYAGCHSAGMLPFLIALSAFFLADGVIGYRLIYTGRLNDLRVLNGFLIFLSVMAAAVLAGFLIFWPGS